MKKSYKGLYRPTNPKKYVGDVNKIVYRSLLERKFMLYCDRNPDITYWASEELAIRYYNPLDKKYHRYFMDLKITYTNGKTTLIEIKPDKETKPPKFSGRKTKRYITEGLTYVKNMNKWAAAQSYAADRNWGFEIWTEDTLHSMGIKPKSTKPLKPYKKRKKTI